MRPILRSLALAAALAVGASGLPGADMASRATGVADVHSSRASASVVEPDANGIAVDVVPSTNGRLVPGSDLTVTLTITNDSTERIPVGTAELFVGAEEASGPDELTEWLDGTADVAALGSAVAQVSTPAVVAGGSARLPPITIPATGLPFGAASPFGVHRVTARVSTDRASSTGTSAITVDPGTGTPATRLALAMPIALPTEIGGVIGEDLLESFTAEGGLLSRQLDEAAGRSVAIGIDPRVIASIRLLGQTAPPSALEWLDRLESLPNETFPLSYADSDIAATSQAGAGVLAPTSFVIDPARFPAAAPEDPQDGAGATSSPGPSAEPSPSSGADDPEAPVLPTTESLLEWDYSRTGIAWPRDSTVVATDLDTFAASGLTTTIVSQTNAGGAVAASAQTGAHPLLVSNDTVSALLRDAVAAPSYSDWQSEMARLTASLAALADGAGTGGAVVFATLDRRSPDSGYQLAATLAVLDGTPWTAPAGLGEALAQPPTQVLLTDSPVGDVRLAALNGMIGIEGSLAQFATAADDPTLVTGERRLALLALTSQSWTAAEADWSGAVDRFLERSRDILASVQVASTVLAQWSDNGDLPLVISNSLPFPVTVNVNVRASSAILDVTQPDVQLTVPGDSQKRALIPVESIANGEVRLVVTLTTLAGVAVSAPASVAVTVNAGWETTATVVLAVLVVAVFVLGIVRTIRRRRRGSRADEVAESGDPA